MRGTVTRIFISTNAGDPMKEVQEVKAIEKLGLEGDRYAGGRGAFSKSKRKTIRQVSLIEQEAIDKVNANLEVPFLSQETRRNIVVKDFPLNGLIGIKFMVGDVRMKGIELCDPCQRPSQLSGKPGFKETFQNCGGLRAEVLTTGQISVGDYIYTAD